MRFILGSMLALLVAGSGVRTAAKPDTQPEDRAVFTAEAARQAWSGVAWEFWTPEAADVRAFESDLPKFLRREMANERDAKARLLWKVAHRYKRQYFGVVKDGRRVILSWF